METGMDDQTATQSVSRRHTHSGLWKPGRSPNPGGISRAQRRYEAYLPVFVEVWGRQPNPIEVSQLRNAAALGARIEGNKLGVEDQVRAGNLLSRLVEKLGLDRRPAPEAPKTPLQNLNEALEAKHGGGT
jgi:hypothetical protein